MQILLSIKPKYVEAILKGTKTVEFRKTPIKRPVTKAQIYMSQTIKKIVAYATVTDIITESPEKLWEMFKDVGGISENDFFEYFQGKSIGYALILEEIQKIPQNLQQKPQHVPQSFCYV